METIGLRELNQNPSKAVARVRAGAIPVVTDRGKAVLRMVPEVEHPSTLQSSTSGIPCSTGGVTSPAPPRAPSS
jgi:antitoxin (DNA-binding transcriptional repressor) of toxin-antitoxin stability system